MMDSMSLRERVAESGDRFVGRFIKDLKLQKGERIVLLERDGKIIIPTGDVQIQAQDLLVINAKISE
jgi:Trk K+ transport system NAD-binding subunit